MSRLSSALAQSPHGVNRCLRGSKQWRRLLAVCGAAAVLGTCIWVGRDRLLLSAADFWIVSDPIGPADAVAVFGGGIPDRPFAAVQYYRQGLVQKILVSNGRQSLAATPDVVMSEVGVTEGILVKLGVPISAIETFGNDLTNTYQEALALKAWARRNNAHSIIVPSEIFPARRVRWMLRRVFGEGFVIRVVALEPAQFHRDDWWRHPQGIVVFRDEILKYVFYRLSY